MEEIPSFAEAVARLQRFLRAQAHPDRIAWAFREDFYSVGVSRHRIRWPLPPENEAHAARLYAAGQSRGLVELGALFHVGDATVATVVAPEPEQIQGWSQGFKLTIRSPFAQARPIALGLPWFSHRLRPAYRHFQQLESFIPRRGRVAA